jgi:hypothetical protein
MHDQTTRRLSNGTIDCAYYRRQATALRNEALVELMCGWRGLARAALAIAIICAPLALAAAVHALKGGPSKAQAALSVVQSAR